MTRKLTLGEPTLRKVRGGGVLQVEWYLLGSNGRGFYVSWLAAVFDTRKPECNAYKAAPRTDGFLRVKSWNARATSYNRDAALALEEVVKQLTELYDVTVSVGDPATALRPGEVVSDAQ